MNSIARMTAADRAEVFAETAAHKGLPEAIIEKDFCVCYINRFSEDIDLADDYAALGFTGARDPRREEISKTRRAAILADMMAAYTHEYVALKREQHMLQRIISFSCVRRF